MQVTFFKSLDRAIDIFGIRGKWITIFLCAASASILFALFVGFSFGSGIGVAAAIVLVVVSFVFCLTIQTKVSYRQVSKIPLRSLIVPCVFRRETLYRILSSVQGYKNPYGETSKRIKL